MEFIHILTDFYHLPISLVLFTYSLIDASEYAQGGLNYTLVCLKQIFLANGYPEYFINKCFKKFICNIHVVKETTLTLEKNPIVLDLLNLGSISLQTSLIVANCK